MAIEKQTVLEVDDATGNIDVIVGLLKHKTQNTVYGQRCNPQPVSYINPESLHLSFQKVVQPKG